MLEKLRVQARERWEKTEATRAQLLDLGSKNALNSSSGWDLLTDDANPARAGLDD